MDMKQAMATGEARYSDALETLGRFGPAVFTQTGGMCAALEVTLERGYLLVTDVDDSLPWTRSELRGWGVGFYSSQDASDGPEVFCDGDAPSIETLTATVEQCLRETATIIARR